MKVVVGASIYEIQVLYDATVLGMMSRYCINNKTRCEFNLMKSPEHAFQSKYISTNCAFGD